MIVSSPRRYTHLVNLIAQRSSALLTREVDCSQDYMSWVRSLEETFGVSIEVKTVMDPEGRPASIGGTIRESERPDCRVIFTVDGEETRCALRYT